MWRLSQKKNLLNLLQKFLEVTNTVILNLDLLRYADHEPTQKFADCLFSHVFVPLISRPPRITAYSATLIDHIFTNHVED